MTLAIQAVENADRRVRLQTTVRPDAKTWRRDSFYRPPLSLFHLRSSLLKAPVDNASADLFRAHFSVPVSAPNGSTERPGARHSRKRTAAGNRQGDKRKKRQYVAALPPEWSWRESNPRPNKEPQGFLHVYSALDPLARDGRRRPDPLPQSLKSHTATETHAALSLN